MKFSTTEEILGLDHTDQAEADQKLNQRLNDFKDTFGTDHGRRVLLAILENTFQHESPMTGSAQTYYNIALVDWGRSLLDIVALADPSTHQWVFAQRANYLNKKYEDRLIG